MLATRQLGALCNDPCDPCLGEIDRDIGVYRWRPCGVKLRLSYGTDVTFDVGVALSQPNYVMDAETQATFCPYGYGSGCERKFCKVFYSRPNDFNFNIPVWSRSTNLDFDLSLAFNNNALYGICDPSLTVLDYNRPFVQCANGGQAQPLVRQYIADDGWLRKTRSFSGVVRSCILETIQRPVVNLEVAKARVTSCEVSRWVPTHIRAQTTYTYTLSSRSRFVGNVVDTVTREDYNWFNLFLVPDCTAYPNGRFGPGAYQFSSRGSTRAPEGQPGNHDITTTSWVVGATRQPNTTTTTSTNTSHNGDSCADPDFPLMQNPEGQIEIATKSQLASNYRTVGYTEEVTGYGPWQALIPGRQILTGALSERRFQQGWDSAALASAITLAQSGGQASFLQCFGLPITNNGNYSQNSRSGGYGPTQFPIATVGAFESRIPLIVELDKCNAAEPDCSFTSCGESIFTEVP